MARNFLISGAMTASLAFVALSPALAQTAPPPPPAKEASIRLDFGMGRKVHIDCGELALAACLEIAKPTIDKVAEAPLPPMMHPKFGRDGKDRFKGKHERRQEAPKTGSDPVTPNPEPAAPETP